MNLGGGTKGGIPYTHVRLPLQVGEKCDLRLPAGADDLGIIGGGGDKGKEDKEDKQAL